MSISSLLTYIDDNCFCPYSAVKKSSFDNIFFILLVLHFFHYNWWISVFLSCISSICKTITLSYSSLLMNSEFQLIHELCLFVLSASQRAELIRATLATLHAFLSWIPLGYIFESPLVCLSNYVAFGVIWSGKTCVTFLVSIYWTYISHVCVFW